MTAQSHDPRFKGYATGAGRNWADDALAGVVANAAAALFENTVGPKREQQPSKQLRGLSALTAEGSSPTSMSTTSSPAKAGTPSGGAGITAPIWKFSADPATWPQPPYNERKD